MKKMTSFMVMLLSAMVPVLFSSCGGNEPTPDSYVELIVGEWDCTRYDYAMEYKGEEETDSEYFDEGDLIWEFDGNKIIMYAYGDYGDTFRYEIEDDKLYTEYATNLMAQYFKIKTLNKTKLVLELTSSYEGATIKHTFNFKRI